MMTTLFTPELVRWGTGFALAALVAAVGWWRGALSSDGAGAATVVGGIVVGAGGWGLGALLVLFFVTSSALSRLRPGDESAAIVARGSRRSAVQVLANGGTAALGALLFRFTGEEAWLVGAAAAIAAANADTWSTELGRHFGRRPRLITTGRIVAPGTSGGVTALGTAAALAGAGLIACGAALAVDDARRPSSLPSTPISLVVAAAGFGGALFDSLLGATVQRLYRCPRCRAETEQPRHRCGTTTIPLRGIPGMTNDTVNALATTLAGAGGLLAGLIS